MSYETIETGAVNVLKLLAGYTDTGAVQNISKGDYRILKHGLTKAVVIQPGPIKAHSVAAAPRRMRTLWVVTLEIFVNILQDDVVTVATRFRSTRQEILDHYDKYPLLNGTTGVVNALITAGQTPFLAVGDVQFLGENSQWLGQALYMDVEERSTVTIAEP